MKDGFLKVAAATPFLKVANPLYNVTEMHQWIDKACEQGVKVFAFPELCITGYTCGDLFLQDTLLDEAKDALEMLCCYLEEKDIVVMVGLPLMVKGSLYNVVALLQNGKVLGIIPKNSIPMYGEHAEGRYFQAGSETVEMVELFGSQVPFGVNQLFTCKQMPELVIAAEVCEDLWSVIPPSSRHALAGATVILNASASAASAGKAEYRKDLVKGQSAKLLCGYIYADAGEGESTTDLVFCGHNMIAENGKLLAEAERFTNGMIVTELDVKCIRNERRRVTSFQRTSQAGYHITSFSFTSLEEEFPELPETVLTRKIDAAPFIPSGEQERDMRAKEIIAMQSYALKKRLLHTGVKSVVVGVSGGLDSTLALLITCRAFDLAGFDRKNIITVTMPCFGTTDRTYQNAIQFANELGTTLYEIPIKNAVRAHFADIGHDESVHDLTYENAQARERTQVLMDMAGKYGGLVIGTGDMSELALGWATYNGDHMSMYGVNASIPKTLVRHLVAYFAKETENEALKTVLLDILDTPVSPELLPPEENGEIAQKTEDLVGPYELHDFFLFYVLRYGFTPSKIYRLAVTAFEGRYAEDVIYRWLENFYRRFFAQQFKRSCLPDGPKVGSVGVSPRGDLRMPSDACRDAWLRELSLCNRITNVI